MWASAWVPAYVDFVAHFPSNRRFFRRVQNRRILSICVVTLLVSSAQPMAIFAFDFVGNTHTEALISLLSKSLLTQAISYLVAVHLHDRCPSSIPTSKISHVTENRCWLWVKDNCNHLSFVCPSQRRHFLVNNYSETCIRRTLAGFSLFTQKSSFTTLSSTKALVSFKTNSNKKERLLWRKEVTHLSGLWS